MCGGAINSPKKSVTFFPRELNLFPIMGSGMCLFKMRWFPLQAMFYFHDYHREGAMALPTAALRPVLPSPWP